MATAAKPRPSDSTSPPAIRSSSGSPEFDLVAACCAGPVHAGRIRKLVSATLDWQRMLCLVDHHRVVPQVYAALATLQHDVPADQFAALRARYQENARKTLWFTAELQHVTSHLESAGIRTLAHKGPALAQALYGDVTQRQFSDLDFLILREDMPKAKATLLELGYLCGPDLRQSNEQAYIDSGCGYVFHSPAGRNLLDLQWRIVPRFYSIDFDEAAFFDRAEEIDLEMEDVRRVTTLGHRVRTLCHEDLLLVLCVHAAKHAWVQLSWLCDIARLISSKLDWNSIQNEARRLGIERIVAVNLFLAHKLLSAPLPPEIQEHLQEDPSTMTLANEIVRIIERSTHYDTDSIPYFRLMLRLRERWQDRARLLWRLTFTPSVSEWSAVQLPKPLHPLYRLVRLLRLGKRLTSASPAF
jgi:putative nucleotidyltransferase-like protein